MRSCLASSGAQGGEAGATSSPRSVRHGQAELSRGAASRASCKPGTYAGGERPLCLQEGKIGIETKDVKRV